MGSVASMLCFKMYKMYNIQKISELGTKERIEVAHQMHSKYRASNKLISRILHLDKYTTDSLFPIVK